MKKKLIDVTAIPKGSVVDEVKRLEAPSGGNDAVVATGSGNLPVWAGNDGLEYWGAVDRLERIYGPACQNISLVLPEGLSVEQARALVNEFASQEIGRKAFTYALRAPEENASPSTAQVLVSGRIQDGVQRDLDHFFRRYRNKLPAFSGSKKDGTMKVRGKLSNPELSLRQNWARLSAAATMVKPPKKKK